MLSPTSIPPASWCILPSRNTSPTVSIRVALRLRAEVNRALEKQSVLGLHIGLLCVLEGGGPISQIALAPQHGN